MRFYARFVAVTVLAFYCLSAAPARAEEPEPSAGILVGGLALAVGGGALSYYGVQKYGDSTGSGSGMGWLWLSTLGSLTMQAGGAVETYWAWRQGEYRLASDLKGGVPLRSRRSLGIAGLALGGAAVIAMYVGALAVFAKSFSCTTTTATQNQVDYKRCVDDMLTAVTIVNLSGGALLLVAAPMVGYGFAYDSAAKRAGHQLSFQVLPTLTPGGAGAQLVARF